MDDLETLKARVKQLNARATTLKMNLHDLSEELPTGWENIPDLAAQAFDAYRSLAEARALLAQAGG
ncbi:MAG TPA: CCE_0567 family metalloprotein [Immundisolibacter sp.]|nr:CCE_0567 family metalloprotein [Immundisolibacter sp.]